jgi:hypothetical protein
MGTLGVQGALLRLAHAAAGRVHGLLSLAKAGSAVCRLQLLQQPQRRARAQTR